MEADLKHLRIDRTKRRTDQPSPWAVRWIVAGVLLIALLGLANFVYGRLNAATEVDVIRVHALNTGAGSSENNVILNATGYIIAAHKIELASKVQGKVSWIGVEKGNKVKQAQVLVRLEDDEFRAQYEQARGAAESARPYQCNTVGCRMRIGTSRAWRSAVSK